MDLLSILFGAILGLFLTIGNGFTAECQKKYGLEVGRLAWMVLVAGPALFAMYNNRDMGIIAILVGTLLSLLLHLQNLVEKRGAAVSLSKE